MGIAYAVVFLLTALFATASLLYLEHTRLGYSRIHLILDSVIDHFLIFILFVYWVQPYLAERWRSRVRATNHQIAATVAC